MITLSLFSSCSVADPNRMTTHVKRLDLWDHVGSPLGDNEFQKKWNISIELLKIVTGCKVVAPIQCHLHSFFFFCMFTSRFSQPRSPVPEQSANCSVTCKPQECNRHFLWGAAINMEGEEQGESTYPWGNPVLMGHVLDMIFSCLLCCFLPVRTFANHWQMGAGTVSRVCWE